MVNRPGWVAARGRILRGGRRRLGVPDTQLSAGHFTLAHRPEVRVPPRNFQGEPMLRAGASFWEAIKGAGLALYGALGRVAMQSPA